jgi:[protein-PII] uridylyltransferase
VTDLSHREHDPAFTLWSRVDQDAVLVAALVRSAFRGDEAAAAAKRLAQMLGLSDDRTELVGFLVRERDLLPAAASRLSLGSEERVLELAAHVRDREHADPLYLLAAATIEEATHREALDELYALIASALAHPELVGAEAADLAEARRREVIEALPRIPDPTVRRLLDAAPRRYLLAHPRDVIARHARMLEPPPTKGEVRIHAEPDLERGEWTVDIVTMDRPGALAAITHAFAMCDVPILEAWIATWGNGAIVDVFRVSAPRDADWDRVRETAARMLTGATTNGGPQAIAGRLDVDNVASPWHTIVEIRAEDRAGLLYKVADAFSRAGVQIHHATVRTANGVAVDTFLVSDRTGRKLDRRGEHDLRLAFDGKLRARWAPSRLLKRPKLPTPT